MPGTIAGRCFLRHSLCRKSCSPHSEFADGTYLDATRCRRESRIVRRSMHRPDSLWCTVRNENLAVNLPLPTTDDQSGNAVANHVDKRAEHAHEAIDSQDERHS